MTPHDEDRVLDHEYDGIQEYDNPMPRWWLATLWGTVIFSVLYLLNVPWMGRGAGWIAAYVADSTAAAQVAAQRDPLAGITAQAIRSRAGDAAAMAEARSTFVTYCAACHTADGGGSIGPNLTDDYFIHGADPMDALRTISAGVLDKGMPTWASVLSSDQLVSVAAYVTTLRGTRPAQPKAPQGVHADSAAAAPGS